jgi:putative peptidoglycan lipid II flippase
MANGIRLTALFTIPASCGLWVMSKPISGLLFQHGNFSAAATANTARALSGLAIGLAGFSIYLFVLRGFYARNDTRTPFFINVGENAINIVLAIVLVDRHGVFGLGLSFSIAYLVSAIVALLILESTEVDIKLTVLAFNIVRIAIAAGAMTCVVWFSIRHIGSEAGIGSLTSVIAGTLIGAATYAVALSALGEKTMRDYLSSKITKSSR